MKTVIFNNKLCQQPFLQTSDQTTLEYLESHGFVINYHCRDGTCGACRCRLNSGSVEYTLQPLAYIRQGDILTCCTRPLTDLDLSD